MTIVVSAVFVEDLWTQPSTVCLEITNPIHRGLDSLVSWPWYYGAFYCLVDVWAVKWSPSNKLGGWSQVPSKQMPTSQNCLHIPSWPFCWWSTAHWRTENSPFLALSPFQMLFLRDSLAYLSTSLLAASSESRLLGLVTRELNRNHRSEWRSFSHRQHFSTPSHAPFQLHNIPKAWSFPSVDT